MGLFDTVHCDYPLPVAGANSLDYQTKSLDPAQNSYRIAADGQLLLTERELVMPDDKVSASREEAPREKPVSDFIGEMRFYSSWGPAGNGWIEWSAYFVRGQLRELHLVRETDRRFPPDETQSHHS